MGAVKARQEMNLYPQPERTHSKDEIKKRAQDRATQAKAMRGKGMSLRVIAADLGLSKSVVRNYVQGVAIPPDVELIRRPRKQRPKQYGTTISIHLSVAIYEALRDSAKDSGRTIGAHGRQMIELGLAAKAENEQIRSALADAYSLNWTFNRAALLGGAQS